MKRKRLLPVLLAGIMYLGMGDMAFAGELQDKDEAIEVFESTENLPGTESEEPEGMQQIVEQTRSVSVPSQGEEGITPEEESFTDGSSGQPEVFSAEGGGIFSSGSEDAEGTEGLEYEYIEETDSYRVVKGVDQKQVDIPAYYEGKPVTEIGAYAFAGYENLRSVTAFDSSAIGMIREGAFENCKNLRSFSVGYAVSIESNAFRVCHRMSWFAAEDVQGAEIASDAFDPDTKVMFFGITPPRVEGCYCVSAEDGSMFFEDGVTLLEEGIVIELPGEENRPVYSIIDYSASQARIDLNYVDFCKESNIIIKRKTFYGCKSIEELILPAWTRIIETKAFGECTNLEKIYIPESVYEISEDAFMGCPKVTLYVTKGSYGEKYAKENNLPYVYDTIQIAPEIQKVTVNKNMITVQFSEFTGDMYYCILGTGINEAGVPIRSGNNGRIAISQTGNKVVFRNVNKGTYYIGARALSIDGEEKSYSGWSKLKKVRITADTPKRPEIASASQTGNTLRVTPLIRDGADGYILMVSRGTTKNDSSTAAAAVPDPEKKTASITKGNHKAATIKNIKAGTYYIGIQSFNRNSDGSRIYSQWSPLKKITVR